MSSLVSNLKSNLALAAKMAYNRHLIRAKCPRGTTLRNEGIGIVAETNYICSLSQLARDFIDKASQTDIPFALINSSVPFLSHTTIKDDEAAHYHKLECNRFDQRHVIHFSTIPCGKDKRYCNAITPFWEFQSGMLEHRPGLFDGADVIIAYSDFLKDYYESLAPAGVRVIRFRYPYCAPNLTDFNRSATRKQFNVPQDAFVVFFNFDYSSCYERKNPEAVLTAFAEAFPSDSDDTMLVFKTSRAEIHPQARAQLEATAHMLGIASRTRFVNDYLSRKDVLALTAASDAYISLHRGEGLGMGMLEAMSLDVPVIATAFGGNTDFVRPDTAFPIPYKLVPAHTNDPAYHAVREWADPDISAAASALHRLYGDHTLASSTAHAAKGFVSDHFSLENFKSDLKTFLTQ